SAYRYGLGAPLAVVIIANPVAAGAIGILRLGERFTAGVPGLALAAGCAVLLGYGVTGLAAQGAEDRPVAPSTCQSPRDASPSHCGRVPAPFWPPTAHTVRAWSIDPW